MNFQFKHFLFAFSILLFASCQAQTKKNDILMLNVCYSQFPLLDTIGEKYELNTAKALLYSMQDFDQMYANLFPSDTFSKGLYSMPLNNYRKASYSYDNETHLRNTLEKFALNFENGDARNKLFVFTITAHGGQNDSGYHSFNIESAPCNLKSLSYFDLEQLKPYLIRITKYVPVVLIVNSCSFNRLPSILPNSRQFHWKLVNIFRDFDPTNAKFNSDSLQSKSQNKYYVYSTLYKNPLIVVSASSNSSYTDYNKTKTGTIFSDYLQDITKSSPSITYSELIESYKQYLVLKGLQNSEYPELYILADSVNKYSDVINKPFLQ